VKIVAAHTQNHALDGLEDAASVLELRLNQYKGIMDEFPSLSFSDSNVSWIILRVARIMLIYSKIVTKASAQLHGKLGKIGHGGDELHITRSTTKNHRGLTHVKGEEDDEYREIRSFIGERWKQSKRFIAEKRERHARSQG
jgi:hypothetical protein